MGRKPLSETRETEEKPKFETKVSVEFTGDLTTDCFRKAISIARAVDDKILVQFNKLAVAVFPDSTVNSLDMQYKTNIELARLYGRVEELEKQLESKQNHHDENRTE